MYKTSSVICSIVKDERLYIREWVDYHLALGFDKIYIYEDYGSVSHADLVQDLIDQGRVELVALGDGKIPVTKRSIRQGQMTQYQLYKWFLNQCKNGNIKADWVGFFDVDEFVTFDDGYNLPKLENEFDSYGGVLLCWVTYGANGHVSRPEGKVIENYTQHMPLSFQFDHAMWCVKSLVNIKNCPSMKTIHAFDNCISTDFIRQLSHRESAYQKCHIRHFYTKSWEDYCFRMQRRGNMGNNMRCYDLFFKCSPEFADKEKEMIDYLRHNTITTGTMWISHKHRVISGGNVRKLRG